MPVPVFPMAILYTYGRDVSQYQHRGWNWYVEKIGGSY
jgi:hypothetical protein